MSALKKQIAITSLLLVIGAGVFIILRPAPGPCRQIRALCESQANPNGKCFRDVLTGEAVEGMEVDQEVVQACKDRQSKRKGRRGGTGKEGRREARI